MGITSVQRVKRSINVRQNLKLWDGGNGPMISKWITLKRLEGIGKGAKGDLMCRETLLHWHGRHSRDQVLMSLFIPGQKNLDETNLLVALIPGCARL